MGKSPLNIFSALCLLGFIQLACTQEKKDNVQGAFPSGYNAKNYQKFRLSEDLDEISGLGYDDRQNVILAVQDEAGSVYHIDPKTGDEIDNFKFAKNGDFEDLAQTPQGWYYLKSNGNLYFGGKNSTAGAAAEKAGYSGKEDEFESLFYDAKRQALMLVCKQCKIDKDGSASVYSFSPGDGKFSDRPVFSLSKSEINAKLKHPIKAFRPSAAAIHPIENKLYVLSSQQKLLVIADTDGKVEQVFELNKKLFKQPEGLCFKSNGDMFISNEAVEGYANILFFAYKR